jgi:carboxymethylenebutenolidase
MTHAIDLPYFTARPRDAEPGGPGVLLVMEGGGISQQLLRVAQRLAGEGYTVVAPDFFHQFGGSDNDGALSGMWGRKLIEGDVVEDLRAAREVLAGMGVGKVGVTGFCMGGSISYLAAVRGVDVACAAPFYGSAIAKMLGPVSCPLLFFFGGQDEWVPMSDIEQVRERYPNDVVLYEDAGHGFFRDGSDSYHPQAAADAWDRLRAFFAAHLR